MIITREVTLINRVYRASLTVTELTELERLRLQQFGDVTLSVGGTFEYSGDGSFTLPANDRRFPTETLFVQKFQIDGDADAGAKAAAWAVEIEDRLVDTLNALIQLSPGPVGRVSTSYTLPTS